MNANQADGNVEKHTVFYDGSCPMCVAMMDKVGASSHREKFDLCDITKDALPESVTRAAAEKEIHVIGPGGKVYRNAEAISKIFEQYPGWKWLALFRKFSVTRWLLSLGYGFVAAHRRHFLFTRMGKMLR
jgi:predicted DCC family thiol-disulfide oxidoreductase YuxK